MASWASLPRRTATAGSRVARIVAPWAVSAEAGRRPSAPITRSALREVRIAVLVGDRARAQPQHQRPPAQAGRFPVAPDERRVLRLGVGEAAGVRPARPRLPRPARRRGTARCRRGPRRRAPPRGSPSWMNARAVAPLRSAVKAGARETHVNGLVMHQARGHLRRGLGVGDGATQGQQIGRHRAEHERRVVVDLRQAAPRPKKFTGEATLGRPRGRARAAGRVDSAPSRSVSQTDRAGAQREVVHPDVAGRAAEALPAGT